MRIWLDDERDPTNPFIQRDFPSAAFGDWTWLKTVEEALPFIEKGEVTAISFDNDLGYNNGERCTQGYHLANQIEALAHDRKIPSLEWHVHTQNPVAYGKICTAMQNADKFWGKQ